MIFNTFFIVFLAVASALPVPQEEPDTKSQLPVEHRPLSKEKKELPGSIPLEIPQNILNKLQSKEVKQQLENAIEFLQSNGDLLKFADKEDAENIFQGVDNIMRKVMDAAKDTISEEGKSIHNAALSIKDAGEQIWETGTQIGKTGIDLTLMLPKFGLNILGRGK
ncbi:hypothetical protein KPH14_009463 [Odynerus spinipes]|uniref:Uncharacterized protein n=1 Tax=Odynerus spinipes TaxID=1348599 RepID=A0AAD9VQQ5_9HYME|nr:hypothetical protein KPH14_009463 [Odynerus spinipes]